MRLKTTSYVPGDSTPMKTSVPQAIPTAMTPPAHSAMTSMCDPLTVTLVRGVHGPPSTPRTCTTTGVCDVGRGGSKAMRVIDARAEVATRRETPKSGSGRMLGVQYERLGRGV